MTSTPTSAVNLFLFAHQDDEYGVYPVLERLVSQREAITIVYLTSGTLDGRRSERRNEESVSVLARIGIDSRDIHFLGADLALPDGKLYRHMEEGAAAVLDLFDASTPPHRVFTPAWEGGHQDHDATHIIACYLAQAFACLETSRQFPLYNGCGLRGILWHTFLPLPDNGPVESSRISWGERLRCLRYGLGYRSQWATWLGLYPMYALHLLIRGKQYLQALHPQRLSSAPHPGQCLYERRGFCTSEQFGYHTRALVDKITR